MHIAFLGGQGSRGPGLHVGMGGGSEASTLHPVFVILCHSLIINIILVWATEAPCKGGLLF